MCATLCLVGLLSGVFAGYAGGKCEPLLFSLAAFSCVLLFGLVACLYCLTFVPQQRRKLRVLLALAFWIVGTSCLLWNLVATAPESQRRYLSGFVNMSQQFIDVAELGRWRETVVDAYRVAREPDPLIAMTMPLPSSLAIPACDGMPFVMLRHSELGDPPYLEVYWGDHLRGKTGFIVWSGDHPIPMEGSNAVTVVGKGVAAFYAP